MVSRWGGDAVWGSAVGEGCCPGGVVLSGGGSDIITPPPL